MRPCDEGKDGTWGDLDARTLQHPADRQDRRNQTVGMSQAGGQGNTARCVHYDKAVATAALGIALEAVHTQSSLVPANGLLQS